MRRSLLRAPANLRQWTAPHPQEPDPRAAAAVAAAKADPNNPNCDPELLRARFLGV